MTDEADRLEVILDDEDELMSSAGQSQQPHFGDNDSLVITSDDLLDIDETTVYPGFTTGRLSSSREGYLPDASFTSQRAHRAVGILSSVFFRSSLVGIVGGLLGWLLSEPFIALLNPPQASSGMMIMHMGIFYALVSTSICVALSAGEQLLAGLSQKALLYGVIGCGVGLLGGFIGGCAAQALYNVLREGGNSPLFVQVIARTLGWALIGGVVGMGPGLAIRSGRKSINGLVGGLVGGGIGGALFDLISWLLPMHHGLFSRAIAMMVMGGCVGIAIALVEEMTKQAWLYITRGPMAGKEFILYHACTTVGSAAKCDITLPKDLAIQPQHFSITTSPAGSEVRAMMGSVHLNGQPVEQARLRDSDLIEAGETAFTFAERAVPVVSPSLQQ